MEDDSRTREVLGWIEGEGEREIARMETRASARSAASARWRRACASGQILAEIGQRMESEGPKATLGEVRAGARAIIAEHARARIGRHEARPREKGQETHPLDAAVTERCLGARMGTRLARALLKHPATALAPERGPRRRAREAMLAQCTETVWRAIERAPAWLAWAALAQLAPEVLERGDPRGWVEACAQDQTVYAGARRRTLARRDAAAGLAHWKWDAVWPPLQAWAHTGATGAQGEEGLDVLALELDRALRASTVPRSAIERPGARQWARAPDAAMLREMAAHARSMIIDEAVHAEALAHVRRRDDRAQPEARLAAWERAVAQHADCAPWGAERLVSVEEEALDAALDLEQGRTPALETTLVWALPLDNVRTALCEGLNETRRWEAQVLHAASGRAWVIQPATRTTLGTSGPGGRLDAETVYRHEPAKTDKTRKRTSDKRRDRVP